MTEPLQIIGSYLSPYVRKVLVFLHCKKIAYIGIAVFFRNAAFAGYRVDAARWPKTARFVARVLAHDAFAHLAPFEERMIRTPIAEHRSIVAEMGAPILAETYRTSAPRRGLMRLG